MGKGFGSIRSRRNEFWTQGTKVKPDGRGAGPSIEGEDDRAFVAVGLANSLVAHIEDRGAILIIGALKGKGGGRDPIVDFLTIDCHDVLFCDLVVFGRFFGDFFGFLIVIRVKKSGEERE